MMILFHTNFKKINNFTFIFYSSHEHIEVLVNSSGDFLFFRHRDGFWVPTLRLLHKCITLSINLFFFLVRNHFKSNNLSLDPYILPWQQVDKGAIRFVLSGANIMCPGLTSPGAKMTPVAKGAVVVAFFAN